MTTEAEKRKLLTPLFHQVMEALNGSTPHSDAEHACASAIEKVLFEYRAHPLPVSATQEAAAPSTPAST